MTLSNLLQGKNGVQWPYVQKHLVKVRDMLVKMKNVKQKCLPVKTI